MAILLVVLYQTLTFTPKSMKLNLQMAQERSTKRTLVLRTCMPKLMMKAISFRYLRRSLTIIRITLLSLYGKVLYKVPMVLNDPRSQLEAGSILIDPRISHLTGYHSRTSRNPIPLNWLSMQLQNHLVEKPAFKW